VGSLTWGESSRDAQDPATHRPEGSPGPLPAPTGAGTHHDAPDHAHSQPQIEPPDAVEV